MSELDETNKIISWIEEHIPSLLPQGKLTDRQSIIAGVNQLSSTANQDRSLICQAMPGLIEANLIPPENAFDLIRTGLLYVYDLGENARINLLLALSSALTHPHNAHQPLAKIVTGRMAGSLILESIELTLKASHSSNLKYLTSALEMLAFSSYPEALPTVQAIAERHKDKELSATARRAYLTLRDTVRIKWTDTYPDLTSTLEQRASLLKDALKNIDLNSDEKVQALFNSGKGTTIDSKSDPRLPIIEALLIEADEKLALAAAWLLCVTTKTNQSVEMLSINRLAIGALADIGVNGHKEGACREASAILEEMERHLPSLKNDIDEARNKANARFLQRFGFKI
ncbi:MAG: hypothetical protein K8F91_21710 [Candidatus Obscuribacterales bacterium]|nr:hypothetical protein [Candidatus Obscuribacterales bacterium]